MGSQGIYATWHYICATMVYRTTIIRLCIFYLIEIAFHLKWAYLTDSPGAFKSVVCSLERTKHIIFGAEINSQLLTDLTSEKIEGEDLKQDGTVRISRVRTTKRICVHKLRLV
jgi:hypothetical protein